MWPFWSFSGGPKKPTLLQNPVKFACQGGWYPWHRAPFDVPPDPNSNSLFNHCSKPAISSPQNKSIWFSSIPVKQYLLSRFMGGISKNAQCIKTFTAVCLRATAIQGMKGLFFGSKFKLYLILFMSIQHRIILKLVTGFIRIKHNYEKSYENNVCAKRSY